MPSNAGMGHGSMGHRSADSLPEARRPGVMEFAALICEPLLPP